MKKYLEIKLKNGAVLRYVKNRLNKITMIDIGFDCGSRCESVPGLAHFTEHMFFSGTKTLNKEEISKLYFDFIGTNAHTSYKGIHFTGTVFTKELKKYLQTVAMQITESPFTQSSVDKEVKVVQQEVAKYKDKYKMKAGEFHNYNIYGLDTFKNSILGSSESVGSIKSKDVKNYVKKYFVAENAEIYVTSPLSVNKVKKIVEKEFVEKLPSNTKFKRLPLFLEAKPYEFFYKVQNDVINKNYLYVTFRFNRNYYDIEFKQKFNLLVKMMNDLSDGIIKDMRIKKSLVYACKFHTTYTKNSADITFSTECDKENVNEVIKTLAEYLNNIKQNKFSEDFLQKIKRLFDFYEDAEEPSVGNKLDKLYQYKYYGTVYKREYFKKIALSTTIDEINNMFMEVFANPQVCISIYGNAKKSELLKEKEIKKLFN